MPSEQISIPAAWIDLESTPILFVNQFISQFNQQEFIVAFGQASPPLIAPGPPEKVQEQWKQIRFVPIKPVARVAMTRARMQELVHVLQQNLDHFDQSHREG